MAYAEPVHGVTDASCFSYWVDVKAVATLPALHFIDKTTLSKDVILYTDEHEWSSWSKIGDRVLHIELRQWADVVDCCRELGTDQTKEAFV
ncbi:putative flavin prenyltransferase [Helianthus annuus]|nr:putative flavin prenyltransferase [Helianthus annuus]KAJ0783928.1 putative flavin prenyltransferase [Helianthus annuus]